MCICLIKSLGLLTSQQPTWLRFVAKIIAFGTQCISNVKNNLHLEMDIICHFIFCRSTLQSGINVGPTFINFGFYSRPYSLIKGPTFIRFWNFYQGLQKFSSLMGFLLHKFAHFVHALCLFKALRLFFLTNFPGPTVIPCPTSIPDSRVWVQNDF